MGKANRVKVSGRPRSEPDLDLLVQAILSITEQRLQAAHDNDEDEKEASA